MTQKNKILVVVTSHHEINENRPTGLWLEEVAVPYNHFIAHNVEVVVASIKGGQAPIDPNSQPNKAQAQQWADVLTALENTAAISSVNAQDFDAIFLPGGHGTMFDLPTNKALQRLLRDFAEADKVIAAVCHGPAGLVGATLSDGTPLVAGKTVTSFTNEEEQAAQLDDLMPFLLETKLRELGANFVAQPMWSDHVEQDGRFITGQNPQSSASVAQAVIETIEVSAKELV